MVTKHEKIFAGIAGLAGIVKTAVQGAYEQYTQSQYLIEGVEDIGTGVGLAALAIVGYNAYSKHQTEKRALKEEQETKAREIKETAEDAILLKTYPEMVRHAIEMNNTSDKYCSKAVEKNLVARKELKKEWNAIYQGLELTITDGEKDVPVTAIKTVFQSPHDHNNCNYGVLLANKDESITVVADHSLDANQKTVLIDVIVKDKEKNLKYNPNNQKRTYTAKTPRGEKHLRAMTIYSSSTDPGKKWMIKRK